MILHAEISYTLTKHNKKAPYDYVTTLQVLDTENEDTITIVAHQTTDDPMPTVEKTLKHAPKEVLDCIGVYLSPGVKPAELTLTKVMWMEDKCDITWKLH